MMLAHPLLQSPIEFKENRVPVLIVENGQLKMGVWQSIYFCEFDGPRQRECYVKVI